MHLAYTKNIALCGNVAGALQHFSVEWNSGREKMNLCDRYGEAMVLGYALSCLGFDAARFRLLMILLNRVMCVIPSSSTPSPCSGDGFSPRGYICAAIN